VDGPALQTRARMSGRLKGLLILGPEMPGAANAAYGIVLVLGAAPWGGPSLPFPCFFIVRAGKEAQEARFSLLETC
jgi:hypothetical protein